MPDRRGAGRDPARFAIGTKSIALDPVWSRPPISEIEMALLRRAAFPEVTPLRGLEVEFVVLDPTASGETSRAAGERRDPGGLTGRLSVAAQRMGIAMVVVGRHWPDNSANSTGGAATGGREAAGSAEAEPRDTLADPMALAAMGEAAFARALAGLRRRVGSLIAASRPQNTGALHTPQQPVRHLLVPRFDVATLAAFVEQLAETPARERPFTHLVGGWSVPSLPNRERFGALSRFGRAIEAMNAERRTIHLYGWSAGLARQLSIALSCPVHALEPVPALEAADAVPLRSGALCVGCLLPRENATDDPLGLLPAVQRAALSAAEDDSRLRFVVEVAAGGRSSIETVPGARVSVVEGPLSQPLTLAALAHMDVLLMLEPPAGGERLDELALLAMASGTLVLGFDGLQLAGTVRPRVLTQPDAPNLGRLVGELALSVEALREAARVSRESYWASARPSRLFAQLLYGPLVLADADAPSRGPWPPPP